MAVNDAAPPEQIFVEPVADKAGIAVKFGLTRTCTALLFAGAQDPFVTCTR